MGPTISHLIQISLDLSDIWWVQKYLWKRSNDALNKHHYKTKSRIFNAFVVKQHLLAIIMEILAFYKVVPCLNDKIGSETYANCILRVWITIIPCIVLSMRLRRANITIDKESEEHV